MRNKIELLAPAGNEESFKAAVNAGADAIYMGLGKHNARVMAKNFTLKSYIECINYAHIRGVKVYLTLNTLVLDEEIKEAVEMVIKLYEFGLDAVIVQDIGLASIIHKVLPKLPLHASTQMSAYSLEQVKFFESLGFTRVVLARELDLKEIEYICKNTNAEIEIFVHGALCVSVSGQCLLSLAIGTRSANRGACAQPCRMRYTLYNNNEKLSSKTYLMSKKDIYTLDILDKVINTGATSLKIEGRNKSPEYVALVVSKYRKYIDEYLNSQKICVLEDDEKDITQIFNRSGLNHGYFDGVKYKNSITTLSPKNTGIYLGEVIEQKGKYIKLKLGDNIDLHDGIEIYSQKGTCSTIVTCIMDKNKKIVNKECKKGEIVYLGDIKENYIVSKDKVYKTSRYKLNLKVQQDLLKRNIRQRSLVLNVDIKRKCPVTLSVVINGDMYTYNTNVIPEEAINKELNLEDLYKVFDKTQDTGIKFEKVVGYVDKGLFLKISDLNEIRRNFVSKIEEKLIIRNDINCMPEILYDAMKVSINHKDDDNKICKNVFSVYSYDSSKEYDKIYNKKYNKALQRIDFQAADFMKYGNDIFHKYSKYNLGLVIPNFVLENLDKYLSNNIELLLKKGLKTIVLGSFKYIEQLRKLKEKYDFTLVADYAFNISNIYSAMFLKNIGFDIIVPAFDATNEQINKISEIVNVELIDDYITVMTSRYCMLGSFVENREEGKKCSAPCTKKGYYIEDTYGEKYNVICSNIDCVMNIIKEHNLNRSNLVKNLSHIRNNII